MHRPPQCPGFWRKTFQRWILPTLKCYTAHHFCTRTKTFGWTKPWTRENVGTSGKSQCQGHSKVQHLLTRRASAPKKCLALSPRNKCFLSFWIFVMRSPCFYLDWFSSNYMYVSVWLLFHACRYPHRGQKGTSAPLELEFQEALGCPVWLLKLNSCILQEHCTPFIAKPSTLLLYFYF